MLKAELEMLEGLKNALNAALIDYDRNHDPEPLYELMHCMEQMFQRLHPHWKWQNITTALLNASPW